MITKGCLVKFIGDNNRVRPIDYNKVYLVTKAPYSAWLSTSDDPQVVDIVVENEILTLSVCHVAEIQ